MVLVQVFSCSPSHQRNFFEVCWEVSASLRVSMSQLVALKDKSIRENKKQKEKMEEKKKGHKKEKRRKDTEAISICKYKTCPEN